MATMSKRLRLVLLSFLSCARASGAAVPALLAWQRAIAGAGAYVAATVITSPSACAARTHDVRRSGSCLRYVPYGARTGSTW